MTEIYPIEAQRAHAEYMRAITLFDRIFCISEHSKTDLLQFLRKELPRLVNVEKRLNTLALPAEFPKTSRQEAGTPRQTDVPITILSVGTLEPRKNHMVLLDAFERAKVLTRVPMRLIFAGQGPFADIAKAVSSHCAIHKEVRWIDRPDDDILGDLYRTCDFTVYPSLEEGFGLPILESLWYARPCICRDAGSMKELGKGGGCILVDTTNPDALAAEIVRLAENPELVQKLATEASQRTFKTWQEYGRDVLAALAADSHWQSRDYPPEAIAPSRSAFHAPILSICISTYNRAPWLKLSLALLLKQTAPYRDVLEVIVCDNASTDETPDVVASFKNEPGFRYFRNPKNVGMLGNLKVTAQHARGQYVWILGDDDLLRHGTVERVMKAILEHPDVSLVYLNYVYTNLVDAEKVDNVDEFLDSGIPIRPSSTDLFAPISKLSTLSENFFTAIYCLVFRRDHALRAYSQNTNGRPFSSLLTCIPTSYYVCQHMMNEAGYWIGEPGPVVNMNVSWTKYAPLWVLERLPELYDLTEYSGAAPAEVDYWRANNFQNSPHYLEQIFFADHEIIPVIFRSERLISRHKHLLEFQSNLRKIKAIYETAHKSGNIGASAKPASLFGQFGLR